MNKVAEAAKENRHHPEWTNVSVGPDHTERSLEQEEISTWSVR